MLATVGLWADSHSNSLNVSWEPESRAELIYVNMEFGMTVVGLDTDRGMRSWYPNPAGWIWGRDSYTSWQSIVRANPFRPNDGFLGFQILRTKSVYVESVSLSAPHWFITLILAILPAIWLFKWNKRRKLGPNACPGCGYDLRGNETGVCPECGVGLETTKA